MRTSFKLRVMLTFVLAWPGLASAITTTTSTISKVLIYAQGPFVYVYPTSGVINPPACHGGNGNYYSFLLTRPYAKEYLAGLLAAQARGATVTLVGYGACTDQANSETLMYFSIDN